MDKRSQKTRDSLLGAMVVLMQEKPWEAITIREVCAQADIARFCAENDRLPDGQWSENRHGFPIIDGAGAVLACRQHAVYPGGDHDIILGEVMGISVNEDAGALTFHRSRYGQLD